MAFRNVHTGFRLRLAIQTSVTVGDHDMDRPADRAVLLAIVTVNGAAPVVICQAVDDDRIAPARYRHVRVATLPAWPFNQSTVVSERIPSLDRLPGNETPILLSPENLACRKKTGDIHQHVNDEVYPTREQVLRQVQPGLRDCITTGGFRRALIGRDILGPNLRQHVPLAL